MLGSVEYLGVEDGGLRIRHQGVERLLEVDHIVLCAGQEPLNELAAGRERAHLIGGAKRAGELDAKRAIREGAELAASL